MLFSRLFLFLSVLAMFAPCCAASEPAQDEFIQMIAGLLRDPDKDMRSLALEQVRSDAPGADATRAFADLLPELPPDAQIGLLAALTERNDAAASPAVRDLLAVDQEQTVRVAAIEALGGLGSAADVPQMVALLASDNPEVQLAARQSLVRLRADDATAAIVDQLHQQSPTMQAMLIEVLTTRRSRSALPAIVAAACDDEPTVRQAAMASLAKLAGPEHVATMVDGVLRAQRGRERDAAEKAIMFVCHRIDEPSLQAKPLLEAMQQLPAQQRTLLLPALGRVGGPRAREVVEQALQSSDEELHQAGLRAICNWPNASVAPRLIELARTEESPGNRRTALRSLIRVAPLPDDRDDQQRLDLLKTALEMCERDEDRRSVLERAKAVRSVETLRFAARYLEQPALAQQACLTIVELAHHSGLRETHREEFHRALDEVMQVSEDPVVVDRAARYKKGQTWVRPKAGR